MKKSLAAMLMLAMAMAIATPAFARSKHHKKHHAKHHAAKRHHAGSTAR